MADHTAIEWTDATWSPVTGCTLVSEGCRHCYAARLAATRLKDHPSRKGLARINAAGEAKFTGEVRFNEQWLDQPLRWRKPRMIFVCAHGDLFHEDVPDEWIDRVFAVMALCPQHTFQVLTKRPERMRAYMQGEQSNIPYLGRMPLERIHIAAAGHMEGDGGVMDMLKERGNVYSLYLDAPWPLPNVWLGTSVEDQTTADARIPHLLATPAAVRFVSAEPLLGSVDLRAWMSNCYECGASCGLRLPTIPSVERCAECGEECGPETVPVFSDGCPRCNGELDPVCPDCGHYMVYQHPDTPCLDWVIVGGESGPGARPMHPDWARSIRDQCAAAGVAFHFKQWGEWAPQVGAVDGWTIRDDPEISRFDHVDWQDDGTAGEPYRPMWCDDLDDDTMARIGKSRSGRLLDGVEHNGMPEVRR